MLILIYGNGLHFWFSFYDVNLLSDSPVGKWLMWKMIKWAKENSMDYVYLGTVYLEKALYKVRDFKGLEFFDGNNWNTDMELLKSKCKNDYGFPKSDLFKTMSNPEEYLKTFT